MEKGLFPDLVNSEGTKWKRFTGLGVDQKHLTVQDKIGTLWKGLWNKFLKVHDLERTQTKQSYQLFQILKHKTLTVLICLLTHSCQRIIFNNLII